jgi:hypothetical protein
MKICDNNGNVQEKERHGETQETINFDGFLSFTPH